MECRGTRERGLEKVVGRERSGAWEEVWWQRFDFAAFVCCCFRGGGREGGRKGQAWRLRQVKGRLSF